MSTKTSLKEITADDFTRRFSLRAPNLMWLLGAGASASAGVPTASDMVWEFKQQLFVSQRRVSPQTVADLSSSGVRAQLQAHVDSIEHLPLPGAPDEYAGLFEKVYPSEADRRVFMDAKVSGAKPSYGHIVLATFMHAGLTRLLWTTNFDTLIADACAKVYDATGALTTVALDAPDLAQQVISEGRWPVEVKLHGDFRSRRLKNTTEELRHQDVRLRQLLVDSCRRFGLVVVGYSGRDDSIMDALEEALNHVGAFPSGLFWLHRDENPPLPRVGQLLEQAINKNIDAVLVPVENFDEILRDLVRLKSDINTKVLETFGEERQRWSDAPRPVGRRGWPVVRLNAIPVVQVPSVCRRVLCKVGGYAEVREAVKRAGVDLIVARTKIGVLAYGPDADVRNAFASYDITVFDLHTIDSTRLRRDSGERGLLRDALTRGIVRERSLTLQRHRSTDLLSPAIPQSEAWQPLRDLVGKLSGAVTGYPELQWCEGLGTRLDWADNRLWLLIEPRIVFDGITETNKAAAADFARERSVKRYNKQLNELIQFWSDLLAGDGGDLYALGIGNGVDAVFRLSPDNGFSWRVGV